MADLKPIGSEKLTGQDKIKRILEIAKFKEVVPNSLNETTKSVYSINLADGQDYQIVKERQGYIIKKVVSESELEYIEPMKNRKYYSSYSQAFKRLNLLAGELNRLNENDKGITFFGEQKKFVLKTPKPEPEMDEPTAPPAAPVEPPAVPQPALPPSPTGDEEMSMDADMEMEKMPDGEIDVDLSGVEDTPDGDLEMDASVESEPTGGEDMVTFKMIQKLTGKLTQKIREFDNQDGMTSENIKYVINMVLSSLELKNLSPEDKEDILEKFEDIESEEGMDSMEDMMPSDQDDVTSDKEVEDIQGSMDTDTEMGMEKEMGEGHGAILDNIFKESKVDKVLSKYFEITKKEILETKEKKQRNNKIQEVKLRKKMTEVVKLSESVTQEIVSEKFLKENPSFNIIGKTNKRNLVFENKEKQIKISPEGDIL